MRRAFLGLLFGAGLFLLMGMLWKENGLGISGFSGERDRASHVSEDMPGDGSFIARLGTSRRKDGSAPVVALTFDDGPHPVYTEWLLDGLKERNTKATFFLIGVNVEGYRRADCRGRPSDRKPHLQPCAADLGVGSRSLPGD